jgi:hypothetical protein
MLKVIFSILAKTAITIFRANPEDGVFLKAQVIYYNLMLMILVSQIVEQNILQVFWDWTSRLPEQAQYFVFPIYLIQTTFLLL